MGHLASSSSSSSFINSFLAQIYICFLWLNLVI
jgi:hypothetical protein